MSLPVYRDALRVPGKLCASPTNLSAAYPHGGTALGMHSKLVVQPKAIVSPITAEEYGGTVVDAIYCGEKPLIKCVLRGWDADAISSVMPNTTVGSLSGRRYIRFEPGVSGQNKPGYRLGNQAIKLLFSPDNYLYNPFLLVYAAIPAWEESAEMALTDDNELALSVAFWATPDSSGRTYAWGWAKDLSL
jgi:hypothetical protein